MVIIYERLCLLLAFELFIQIKSLGNHYSKNNWKKRGLCMTVSKMAVSWPILFMQVILIGKSTCKRIYLYIMTEFRNSILYIHYRA